MLKKSYLVLAWILCLNHVVYANNDSPLYLAAINGDSKKVQSLLSAGADVDAVGNLRQTPLFAAVRFGNLESVRLLLEAGANVNAESEGGATPLLYAVCSENLQKTQVLIEKGAEVNVKTKIMNRASKSLNVSVLQALLDAGGNPNEIVTHYWDVYGTTPLHSAMTGNTYRPGILNAVLNILGIEYPNVLKTVEVLLKAGADVNACDRNGQTPLYLAIEYKVNLETINSLLKAGADVNACDRNGHTPLHVAIKYNVNLETINSLLKAGADVNACDRNDQTSLLLAIEYKVNLETVKALLKAGADVSAYSRFGNNPLSLAFSKYETTKNNKIINELLNAPLDKEGNSNLHHAVKNQDIRLIKLLLLKANADLRFQNKEGETPMHAAVSQHNENTEALKTLLDAGANPELKDIKGVSVLAKAVQSHNYPAIKLLKARGANALVRDFNKNTLLHYAAHSGGDEAMILTLRDFKGIGDLINATNSENKTPLCLAAQAPMKSSAGHFSAFHRLLINGADPTVQCNGQSLETLISQNNDAAEAKNKLQILQNAQKTWKLIQLYTQRKTILRQHSNGPERDELKDQKQKFLHLLTKLNKKYNYLISSNDSNKDQEISAIKKYKKNLLNTIKVTQARIDALTPLEANNPIFDEARQHHQKAKQVYQIIGKYFRKPIVLKLR